MLVLTPAGGSMSVLVPAPPTSLRSVIEPRSLDRAGFAGAAVI
jgi:hypothetical protein